MSLEVEIGRYTVIYEKHTKVKRERYISERLCTLCNMELS